MGTQTPDGDAESGPERLVELERGQAHLRGAVRALEGRLTDLEVAAARDRRLIRAVLWTAVLCAGLVSLFWVVQRAALPSTMLWREVYNTGHMPMFGLVAFVLLGLSKLWLGARIDRPLPHYLLALVGTVSLGAAHELWQLLGPRDADVGDLGRDLLGAGAVLLLCWSFDRRTSGRRTGTGWRRAAMRLLALALFLLGLVPLARLSADYAGRNGAFPLMASFDAAWERRFLRTSGDARLAAVDPPGGWSDAPNGRVGELVLESGTYPGLHLLEPRSDWRGYEWLGLSVFSPASEPVTLVLRIDDRHHNGDHSDRFNTELTIHPGLQRLRIPLSEIRDGPQGRSMDLSAIAAIILFAVEPAAPIAIYIDEVGLE